MFLRAQKRKGEDTVTVQKPGNLDMHVSWMIVKLNHSCLTLYSKIMKGLKDRTGRQDCLVLRIA